MEWGFRQCEEIHECADVELVLVKRILKSVFLPIDLLRPLALFFVAEDPAFVVFCFDHEDAEWRNEPHTSCRSTTQKAPQSNSGSRFPR